MKKSIVEDKDKVIINIELNAKSHSAKSRLIKYIGRVTSNVKRTKKLDEFFFETPSLAYSYLNNLVAERDYSAEKSNKKVHKFIKGSFSIKNAKRIKVSKNLEGIFSKNTIYAMNYLILTNQSSFEDADLQKNFTRKVYANPHFSFFYAAFILNKRIPKEKEKVFLKDYKALYHYARIIIEGRFDEDIEKKLLLRSFSNEYSKANCDIRTYEYTNIDYLKRYLERIDSDCEDKSTDPYYRKEPVCWTYLQEVNRSYF